MASLKEISLASGVSIRTVARALHQNGYVGQEARQRVLEAAERLGYSPNLDARALKTGRSREVLAVLGSMDELLMEKIAVFEQSLRAADYWLHVVFDFGINDGHGLTDMLQEALALHGPAAVALFPRYDAPMHQAAKELAARELPYVIVDGILEHGSGVRINRQQGVFDAVMHLARLGRHRIAYLGPLAGKHVRTRLDGYERAVAELGREPILVPINKPAGEREYEIGREGGEMLLQMSPRPDAVQVHSDVMALGLMAVLHEHGVRVPEEVAVVGFDNRTIAGLCWPRLTTVAQPNREAGQAAAEMLLAKVQGQAASEAERTQTLPTCLMLRESA